MRTDEFDYRLPPELIAQHPAEVRDQSRLMVVHRRTGAIDHRRFCAIGEYLERGDLLVANRSRVIPARLFGRKPSGGRVELLLLRRLEGSRWTALARPSRRLQPGVTLSFPPSSLRATIVAGTDDGQWTLDFTAEADLDAEMARVGETPLPPYITAHDTPAERYQTVYADRDGSVAAPTAGLHFTPELLDTLAAAGVERSFVTLHVGLGTFRPVAAENIEEHSMHAEWGEVPPETVNAVNAARTAHRRVIAVGTTTTRLLESAARGGGLSPFRGETDIFIRPGFEFQVVDALVTNFHLPRSTLLMLVSSFAGRALMLRAYEEAIEQRYRFYSFGDAMLIL